MYDYIGHFPCGSVDWNTLDSGLVSGLVVTSLAEVWIETLKCNERHKRMTVTSLAEVWIETTYKSDLERPRSRHFPCGSVDWNKCNRNTRFLCIQSLPLRKCGLKRSFDSKPYGNGVVTSLAEVWIETQKLLENMQSQISHFPCGSVDWNIETAL